MMIVIDNRDA